MAFGEALCRIRTVEDTTRRPPVPTALPALVNLSISLYFFLHSILLTYLLSFEVLLRVACSGHESSAQAKPSASAAPLPLVAQDIPRDVAQVQR